MNSENSCAGEYVCGEAVYEYLLTVVMNNVTLTNANTYPVQFRVSHSLRHEPYETHPFRCAEVFFQEAKQRRDAEAHQREGKAKALNTRLREQSSRMGLTAVLARNIWPAELPEDKIAAYAFLSDRSYENRKRIFARWKQAVEQLRRLPDVLELTIPAVITVNVASEPSAELTPPSSPDGDPDLTATSAAQQDPPAEASVTHPLETRVRTALSALLGARTRSRHQQQTDAALKAAAQIARVRERHPDATVSAAATALRNLRGGPPAPHPTPRCW